MKRILGICIALCLVLLCACTAQPADGQTETAAQTVTEAQTVPTETQTETEAQSVTETTVPQTETTAPQPANLSVSLADGASALPDGVHVTADAGEPAAHLVFKTDREVRSVQVLSLFMTDYDENTGKPVYDVKTVKTLDALTPQMPLIVTTVFYGDLPNNGIAYTDSDGSVHRFAVEMSGEDGSVFLSEF